MFADGPFWFNAEGDFDYTANLSLAPSENADPTQMVVAFTSEDHIEIHGEDADIEAQVLPKFSKVVREKVAASVNAQVASRPAAQWFASLGFTVSFRGLSIDEAGIHVLPSLCKVD